MTSVLGDVPADLQVVGRDSLPGQERLDACKKKHQWRVNENLDHDNSTQLINSHSISNTHNAVTEH